MKLINKLRNAYWLWDLRRWNRKWKAQADRAERGSSWT